MDGQLLQLLTEQVTQTPPTKYKPAVQFVQILALFEQVKQFETWHAIQTPEVFGPYPELHISHLL